MKPFLHEWTLWRDFAKAYENLHVYLGSDISEVSPLTGEKIDKQKKQEKFINALVGDFSDVANSTDGNKANGNQTCKMLTDTPDLINWCFVINGYEWQIKGCKPSNTDGDYYYEYTAGRTIQKQDEYKWNY